MNESTDSRRLVEEFPLTSVVVAFAAGAFSGMGGGSLMVKGLRRVTRTSRFGRVIEAAMPIARQALRTAAISAVKDFVGRPRRD